MLSFATLTESGLLDSNQRPRAPQTCALPTALNPVPFLRLQSYYVYFNPPNNRSTFLFVLYN